MAKKQTPRRAEVVPSWLREAAAEERVHEATEHRAESQLRELEARLRARYEISEHGKLATAMRDAMLGRSIAVAFGDANEVELARVEVPVECTQSWRVTWTVDSAQRIGYTRVRLRWGTAGTQHEADLDWAAGGVLSVVASFVSVSVVPAVSAAGNPLQVAASIGPGEIAVAMPLTRTEQVGLILGASDGPTIPVPPFARALQTYIADEGRVLVTKGVDSAGTLLWTIPTEGSTGSFATNVRTPIPFPGHTASIILHNNTAAPSSVTDSQLVFFLELG